MNQTKNEVVQLNNMIYKLHYLRMAKIKT